MNIVYVNFEILNKWTTSREIKFIKTVSEKMNKIGLLPLNTYTYTLSYTPFFY